jgi:hypothetical protein
MDPNVLEDIVAKAATMHATKVAYDIALAANNAANATADAAKAALEAGVNTGATESVIIDLINQYVAAGVAKAQSLTALYTAGTPYSEAQGAMWGALDQEILAES